MLTAALALSLSLAFAGAAAAGTRTMYLWADQLTPADGQSLQNYDRQYGVLGALTTAGASFTAPVRFPKGAVIKAVSFIVRTGAAAGNGCSVGLYRSFFDIATATAMEEIAYGSVAENQALYAEIPAALTASRAKIAPGYRYWVKAHVGSDASWLKGIKIRYRVP